MRCPTFTFKNKQTGQCITINQSDYLNERYQYITNLGSLNNWERISESGAGGNEGFEASKVNSDIAIQILDNRKQDRLDKQIILA